MENSKLELNTQNVISADEMVDIIDNMMNKGVSRLKIKESEELDRGTLLSEYHHGRCDIGSPWAKGECFDVLE